MPLFVNTTGCDDKVPTVTLPKLTLDVLAESCSDAANPVPVRLIAKVEGLALLSSEMIPDAAPAEVGLNETVKFALSPGPRVSGVASPDTLKPAPDMAAPPIVRMAVPVFDTVIVWEFVAPTMTFPKATGDGLTEIAAARLSEEDDEGLPSTLDLPVRPMQLAEPSSANRATAAASTRKTGEPAGWARFGSFCSCSVRRMSAPRTEAQIVNRKSSSRLLDAGTYMGQVDTPVR